MHRLYQHRKKLLYGFAFVCVALIGGYCLRGQKQVLPVTEQGLKRVENFSPHYSRFARNSFLIEKGEYAKALSEAQAFKAVLEQQMDDSSPLLYLCNLLRIASLQMQLGNRGEELASWKALKEAGKAHPQAWAVFLQSFQKWELSLLDFISVRERY